MEGNILFLCSQGTVGLSFMVFFPVLLQVIFFIILNFLEVRGIEPLTSWMPFKRSSQLSYTPGNVFNILNLRGCVKPWSSSGQKHLLLKQGKCCPLCRYRPAGETRPEFQPFFLLRTVSSHFDRLSDLYSVVLRVLRGKNSSLSHTPQHPSG